MVITGHSTKRQLGSTIERNRGAARHCQAGSRHILARGTVLAGFVFVRAAISHADHRCGLRHGLICARHPRPSCGLARQAADHPEQQDKEKERSQHYRQMLWREGKVNPILASPRFGD